MAIYATANDLAEYLRESEVPMPAGDAVDRLLERAEIAVDLIVGPWPWFANGRKFDPEQLDTVQRVALSRATCAAAEHILSLDADMFVGGDDYAPPEVTVLRRAARTSPRAVEELAGHGLIRKSGTLAAPVELAEPLVAPSSVLGPYKVRDGSYVVREGL